MTRNEITTRRRLLAGSMIFLLVLWLLALTAAARPGNGNGNGNNTVALCHFLPVGGGQGSPPSPPHESDPESGSVYVLLYVAPAAQAAHLAHGDALFDPDEGCGEGEPPT